MTLKEHMQISRRGIRLLYSMSRRYLVSLALGSIVTAITPYVPIYFSARLIDALSVGAGIRVLALYASLTVGLAALLSLIGSLLKAQQEIGNQQLTGCGYNWLFSEKSMELAYALPLAPCSPLPWGSGSTKSPQGCGWSIFPAVHSLIHC